MMSNQSSIFDRYAWYTGAGKRFPPSYVPPVVVLVSHFQFTEVEEGEPVFEPEVRPVPVPKPEKVKVMSPPTPPPQKPRMISKRRVSPVRVLSPRKPKFDLPEWFALFRLDRLVLLDGCRVKIGSIEPLAAGRNFTVRYQRVNSHGRASNLELQISVDPADPVSRERWDFSKPY